MRFLTVLVLALLMEGQHTYAELIACDVCEKPCPFKALERPRGHSHVQKSVRKVKIKVSKKIAYRAGRKRSCCRCCTRGGRKWGKADDSNYLSSDDDQRNINLTMLNDEDEVEDYLDQMCDDFDEDLNPRTKWLTLSCQMMHQLSTTGQKRKGEKRMTLSLLWMMNEISINTKSHCNKKKAILHVARRILQEKNIDKWR